MRHSCRLQKVLYEFHGIADPQQVAEVMASQISKILFKERCDHQRPDGMPLWEPIDCFSDSSHEGRPAEYVLAVSNPDVWKNILAISRPDTSKGMPSILVGWTLITAENGSPPMENLSPQAEQP